MPDLDQLFRALQSDADLIPSADVSVVHASGRRRRLRHSTAGAVAIGIAVCAVLAGPALWPGTSRPPANNAPTTVTFAPLRAVGGEEVTFGTKMSGRPGSVATAVADGRGYVVWQDDAGRLTASALDIGSGRRLWGPVELERTTIGWAIIYALPHVVVIASGSDDPADAAVTMLDPITGERLWQPQFHNDGLARDETELPYESAIVVTDRSTGVIEAIEWRTGRTLWRITDPSGSLVTVLGMHSSEGMTAPGGFPVLPLPYSDHRLVVIGGDRVVRVYDVATGQLLGSRTAVGNEALAYDGTVFAVRDSTSLTLQNQVLAYQAVGTDAPRTVYESPLGVSRIRALTACGAHRICFVEGHGSANVGGAEVVAVDLDAQASVWRTQSADLDNLTPMGEGVLGRTDGGLVGLYGADRAAVLLPQGSAGIAGRIDAGSVLLLRPATQGASQAAGDTDVVGVVVATGEQVALGQVRVWPTSCSWDARSLLCATGTGFQVWRFSAG
jgi:molecular chaperone HscA